MSKKIITCDIDGVLTDYPNCWLKFLQEKCGTLYNSTNEAKENEPRYYYYKDLYRESVYKANLPIIESNKQALNQLAEKFDIIFATSRPLNNKKYPNLKENTYNWLKNNGLRFKELRFKDEEAKFLEDLEIDFHIDDEVKYANSVSKQLNKNITNEKRAVYLINSKDSLDLKSLDENIVVVKNIQEIIESPFFSVCIPATNRGDTIYNTLNSIAKQSYRNFELIIVDCASKDNTVSEIERFFSSNDYKNRPFKYKFKKYNYEPIETEDWNDPIKLATGKYIAMLEGDDKWISNHLLNAYNILTKHPNVGIYGSSNLSGKRSFQGLLEYNYAKDFCYNITDPVPPSESIFIRVGKDKKPFLYNSKDYKYSPEIALYMDIILNGFNLYYSQIQDVYREPSTNPDKFTTWYYFVDRFVLIDSYEHFFRKIKVFKSRYANGIVVCKFAFYSKSFRKWMDLIKNLKKEIGIFLTVLCIVTAVVEMFFNIFKKIIKVHNN